MGEQDDLYGAQNTSQLIYGVTLNPSQEPEMLNIFAIDSAQDG